MTACGSTWGPPPRPAPRARPSPDRTRTRSSTPSRGFLTSRHVVPGSNRLLSLAAAVGSIALLAVVIFMLWPADPSDTATADRDQSDGETIGWVSKVEANTIHVNSGPFGGGVIPLVVTRNTRITIGSKEGWFEDIRPGGQVKVVYQVAHGKRLARTVEGLVDEGPRGPAPAERRGKS